VKSILDLAREVFVVESQAILALQNRLGESFLSSVDLLSKCSGKVVVTGIGKSGQIGRKIASTFASTGTQAVFLHPAESSHGDLGLIGPNDIVVAISYGGQTPELSTILGFVTRKNIPLIAMTGKKDSDLAKKANFVLDVFVEREACPLGLAPTASSIATLAMGDALCMAVLEAKGFSAKDFAEYHPGGGLGLRLAKVKDLMHSGKALPLVDRNASMKMVITLMSSGEVRGAVGVVDENQQLIGVITDGDLRRKLEEKTDPLALRAEQIMSLNPRTIDGSEIVEKALFLMEQFRINLLFVVDAHGTQPRQPIGLIHIQDLLKSKIR
jgi:arabinose-5-phosphate isomerase